MDKEVALTILVPLAVVGVFLLAMAAISKIKHWRKRRTMERGLKKFLRQAGS